MERGLGRPGENIKEEVVTASDGTSGESMRTEKVPLASQLEGVPLSSVNISAQPQKLDPMTPKGGRCKVGLVKAEA